MTIASLSNSKHKPRAAAPIPLGVLVIGRKRPGFDQEWNAIMRAKAADALRELGYESLGAELRVVDDDTIIAAIEQIRADGAEALLVLQPSLGNGQLALTVSQQWPDPVVLWATPERPDGEKASSCSLVAQHLWGSTFRQAKHPFEIVLGHPDDADTRRSLARAITVCRAASKLKRSKVGLIGGHAPGFLAMGADMFALRRILGVQLHNLSLVQFIERARAVDEADAKRDVEHVRSLSLPTNGVGDNDLEINSRYYLAMRELIGEERLDALAIQCWPELPNVMGQWPYLALARLADEGFACSMEGDTDGALTCLAANLLGAGHGFITDWLEHDDETIHFWHAGSIPLGMSAKPSLARHFNITKPLVVDGSLRAGEDVTAARLWRCDDAYHMTAFEGRTIPPRRELSGNTGLMKVDGGGVKAWFETLIHAGVPHHPVVFYGRHAQTFRRLARTLQINWLGKD